MTRSHLTTTVLTSLMCYGCTPTPVRYYTLTPPIAASAELVSATCCKVQVKRVAIPTEVDRPELVTRRGDDQLIVLSNDMWLGPLRDEIRSVLSQEINFKVAEGAATRPAPQSSDSVWVNVTRFESVPAEYVVVTAEWRLQGPDFPRAPATCATTAKIPVQSGMSALVHGYQKAITAIADHIAVDILNPGPCMLQSAL